MGMSERAVQEGFLEPAASFPWAGHYSHRERLVLAEA